MNRLADETSPYLRQHADNPVDWYPWGDEAFERARDEDRPVFLSIGYSSCHWCHVMAHESFEDPAVAEVLNTSFVAIKVDREERPDVDAVYMDAVVSLTGSGGWPMSVFLTPDRRPFYGGTYFPPTDRGTTPSFRTVLAALSDVWAHQRADVETQAEQLAAAITEHAVVPDGAGLLADLSGDAGREAVDEMLERALVDLGRRFDPVWGGFGGPPKFPQPVLCDLALLGAQRRRGTESGDRMAAMAVRTLDAMAAGGIHDHLGGGFSRYSTDRRWRVPHFEKMLYDQAGLLRAFLHGWQVTGRPDHLRVVTTIAAYVASDLTTPEGGVCSAEDADSIDGEGTFYAWTPDSLAATLGELGSVAEVADFFGVTQEADFEAGSVLHRPVGEPLTGSKAVESAREVLAASRAVRPRPTLDDKVLTEWNAMYAAALAEAAAATGEETWAGAAVAIGEFLWSHSRAPDGRWLRSWQRGRGARHLACAGDYAWLVDCFTRLGELTGEARWTSCATETADGLLLHFADREHGGFFTTGDDAEVLIVRQLDLTDGATASANGVAARSLARLAALTGEDRYCDAAAGVVRRSGDLLARHPTAVAETLLAADLLAGGTTEVVVVGDRPDLLATVRRRWLPGAVVAWGEPTTSPLWHDRIAGAAYVCHDHVCELPATDPVVLAGQLDARVL